MQTGMMDAPAVKKAVQRNGLGVNKEKEKVTAIERKQHLIVGISTEGSSISDDGSQFSIDLSKFPLHVPPNAFNVGIRLVDLVIPYVWPNYSNTTSEKLKITFQDERDYTLTEVGSDVEDYTVPEPSTSNIIIGGTGSINLAFEGAKQGMTGYVTGDWTSDINGEDAVPITAGSSKAISGASKITGAQSFMTHLAWEEVKSGSQAYQTAAKDIIVDAGFMQVYRIVSSETGFQELWIRFLLAYSGSIDDDDYVAYRLDAHYKWNQAHVLTVIGDRDYEDTTLEYDIDLTVVYDDSVIRHAQTETITAVDATGTTFTWNALGGTQLNVGLHAVAVSNNDDATVFNVGSTDTLNIGYVTDTDSYWYQHGILMSAFVGNWELRPHVKLQMAGIGSDSGYEAGDVLEIPILHDDDNELTFVTIPTLLGYMQGVVNQYVFREFYLTQFLSVDLVENHTGSNGTNYLVQFDYNLGRSTTVASLNSSFTMDSGLYPTNGDRMRVKMSNAPYYVYTDPNSGSDDLPALLTITISTDGTNETPYTFDITDLDDLATNNIYATPDDGRSYIMVSRTDLAQFVYVSLSRALKEEDLGNLAPWASRSSQPSTSPLTAFYDQGSSESMDLDYAVIDAVATVTQNNFETPRTDGTYTGVSHTGGSGTGATFDVVVTSGIISSVTVNTGGSGYQVGDVLTVASADIGGDALPDLSLNVATLEPSSSDETSLTTGFTFKFKDPNDWVDNDGGSVSDAAYIKIDASNLAPDWSTDTDTDSVKYVSYNPSDTFLGETTINTGGGAVLDYSVFNKLDNLTFDIILQDGVYSTEYLNTYLQSQVNEFFHSSSHGSNGAASMIQVRPNEFTQQMQIGVLLADNDPGLSSRAEITFPEQDPSGTATNNGFAQMLFAGTTDDLENNPFVVSAGGESSGALEYTALYEDYTSGIVPKPSYDDENIQIATLDFSRVVSNFVGIRHVINANDPGSRIFDFDPFSGDATTDVDKNLKNSSYEIEIPTGSYTADTLQQMIDYLLHQQNPNIVQDVIQIRELKSVQKLQLGALVSSDPNNAYPHKVTFHKDTPEPTTLASLIGWDLEEDVVITAPDFRETNRTITPNYASYFPGQTNFETRSIMLISNFSRNATSPDGSPMQIVSAFAPRAQRGENIIINPNQPIISDAGTYLKDNKLDEIQFTLIDGRTKLPLPIGTEDNDGYTVVLALEYSEQKDQSQIMRPADYTNLSTGV